MASLPSATSYFTESNRATLPTAASPTTAAAMASPTSKPLTFLAAGAGGRGAGVGLGGRVAAGPVEVGGRATEEDGLPEAGGTGAAGALVAGRGAAAAAGADAAGAAPPVGGAPTGAAGNLIVGAAVGFGGRLIRTVSFLG